MLMEMNEAPDKKVIRAWCMYDWANSVYNLVITTTFFPVYYDLITEKAYHNNIPFLGRTFKSTALYSYAVSFSYLAIAICLPWLTAMADASGSKKRFMQFFTYLGSLACIGLYWFKGEQPSMEWGIGCFMVAAIGYAGSLVFYNSYLPDLVPLSMRDRISARGYSMGYFGSVILQAIGFCLVYYFNSQGDAASGLLYTFILVGLWWMSFSQITFYHLPKSKPGESRAIFLSGYRELRKVWLDVKDKILLKRFLYSFFFYSMGIQTVMVVATLVGSREMGLSQIKLIVSVVLIQLVAIPGAVGISRLSERFGNIKMLLWLVLVWMMVCLAAYQVIVWRRAGENVEIYFYLLATCIGLVMGGIQALSRSTYSKMLPNTFDTASYFSYYDVVEKLAIVMGTFLFGYMDESVGTKNSLLLLIVFFAVGGIFLRITLNTKGANKL